MVKDPWVFQIDVWGHHTRSTGRDRSLRYWLKHIRDQFPNARKLHDAPNVKIYVSGDDVLIIRKCVVKAR